MATTKKTEEKQAKPKKTLARADKPVEKEEKPVQTAKTVKSEPAEFKLPTGKYYYADGKRKTSIARVRLYKGDGAIFVNGKSANKYFTLKIQTETIKSPLKLAGLTEKFNITAVVTGGGLNSQADALRHAIARALTKVDETIRPTMKHAGFLTRDPRIKERKKYGFRKARRGRQFSKR